jgi:hypothetical protein
LFNPITQDSDFFILNDGTESADLMFEAMDKWTHRKTPLGFDFDKFEDDDYCDFCDPTRYALNPFIVDRKITISASTSAPPQYLNGINVADLPNEMKTSEQKQELMSQVNDYFNREFKTGNIFAADPNPEPDAPKNKKTPIKFSF